MTPTLIPERVEQLDHILLKYGAHHTFDDGACAMEAVSWLAGEEHSDHPACVSPILSDFLRSWNDALDEDVRQKLKPCLPKTIGTAGDGHDELRGWLCADWLVRTFTPAWLELGVGVTESAAELRALAPLRDLSSTQAARPAIAKAKSKACAAGDAARAAARAAARDAAVDAAGDATRDAAGAAAKAAARDAALDAARDAAWDAALDAAWAAAWDAAGAAAWDAAGDAVGAAAGAAARAAARAKLEPTKVELQASAFELFDTLIDPTR